MKKFIKMKYEQFMIRLYDWVLYKMYKDENLAWYPHFALMRHEVYED